MNEERFAWAPGEIVVDDEPDAPPLDEPARLNKNHLGKGKGGGQFAKRPAGGTGPGIEVPDILDAIKQELQDAQDAGLNDWPVKGPEARTILGDARDTQELHRGRSGGYTAKRKVVHDRIVGKALAPGLAHVLGPHDPITEKVARGGVLTERERDRVRAAAAAKNGGPPRALFLAGGPGSGKTSALDLNPQLRPAGAVTINPDSVQEDLPEYKRMVRADEKYAATGAHEEASDISKRLLAETTDLGLNTVIDGTGNSSPGKFVGKLNAIHDAGYTVDALYVTIPTNVAVKRTTLRARQTGRWVPEPEVRTQHRNVSANFPEVAALPFIDSLKVYSNAGTGPTPIAEGAHGQITRVDDQAGLDAFLAKAKETP